MYSSIRFGFAEFRRELELLSRLTRRFLDPSSQGIFRRLVETLEQLQNSNDRGQIRWEVAEGVPLRTIESNLYEPGNRRGGLDVFGEISWCWEIQAIPPAKGNPTQFEVSGIASVKLRVCCKQHDRPDGIGMWRVEVGARDAPGCHFHTQILGEHDEPPFPHALTVPRLPSLFVTPMAAIEFFLGELFQDAWAQHIVSDQGDGPFWNGIQQRRLTDLFDWKREQVGRSRGSPWIALKMAKPSDTDGLFFGKGR